MYKYMFYRHNISVDSKIRIGAVHPLDSKICSDKNQLGVRVLVLLLL